MIKFPLLIGENRVRANLDSAESYDTTTNSWHDMAPMNAKRWAPGAATLAHCVYAIGGYNGSAYLSSAEKYCTAAEAGKCSRQ